MHFQERPWDLFLSLGYVAAVAGFILTTGQGILVAILLVLFIPGYVLVAALFPEDEEINWIERVALSLGLSIAVVPILGLLLNFTAFGIRLLPLTASILIFAGGLGIVAYIRRMRLAVEMRLSATIEIKKPAWPQYSAMEKALTIGLVMSLLFTVTVLAYVLSTPRAGDRFTEFYLLGPEGRTENYPEELRIQEEGTVLIGVANHEFVSVGYTVRVDLVGVQFAWNETGGYNETMEVNRTTMTWMNLSLAHAANWSYAYTFQIEDAGLWQVQFLLFRDQDLISVYQNLHLIVRVRTGP